MIRFARKPLLISIALLLADFSAAFVHVLSSQVKRLTRKAYESGARVATRILVFCGRLNPVSAKPTTHVENNQVENNQRDWPVGMSKVDRTPERK